MTSTEKIDDGMYFLSLELENVRCFAEKQTLDLSDGNGRPAQWTVILGDNGTGKTTLLEVLEEYNIDDDSKLFSDFSNIEYCFAYGNILENKKVNFSSKPIKKPINFIKQRCFLQIDEELSFMNSYVFFENHPLKIYSYKATRKLTRVGKKRDYDELIDAEKWLLETDYIANKKSEIQESYKKRFEIIKETLINLLPDVKDIHISEPSEKFPNPRAEFKTPDGWLLLNQLSLGYQTMTAWMVDLAAGLFEIYPKSPNPIAEPAVVLIDEIDLHLHPKWQRTIMSYLSERFINTQFIVTAHSPLIVQAAENANIVVLKREANGVVIQKQPEDVHGWRVDQLLTSDLFNLSSARSPYYENLLQQRRDILSKAELNNEDKQKLKALESEMGYLPTAETAEDIKAMDIIRRAAQLLK